MTGLDTARAGWGRRDDYTLSTSINCKLGKLIRQACGDYIELSHATLYPQCGKQTKPPKEQLKMLPRWVWIRESGIERKCGYVD